MLRKLVALAAGLLFFAVAAGAFGAHGLKAMIDPAKLATWHTAVTYQFYHGMAILLVTGLGHMLRASTIRLVCGLFSIGILLFCGSLYLLAISDISIIISTKILGPITPLGGLFFLAGWAILTYRSLVDKPID